MERWYYSETNHARLAVFVLQHRSGLSVFFHLLWSVWDDLPENNACQRYTNIARRSAVLHCFFAKEIQ